MKETENASCTTHVAPAVGRLVATGFEDSLIVDSPLSIHRGLLKTIPSDGIFEIEVGFPFSDALVQLIPITRGGSPCTLDSVRSSSSGASKLKVEYQVSDAHQLLQIAFIVFVTS